VILSVVALVVLSSVTVTPEAPVVVVYWVFKSVICSSASWILCWMLVNEVVTVVIKVVMVVILVVKVVSWDVA